MNFILCHSKLIPHFLGTHILVESCVNFMALCTYQVHGICQWQIINL